MDVLTRKIRVERATVLEWPQIEALRRAYFAARNEPVQRRPPAIVWYVALIGERVVGCYSAHDLIEDGQRWVHDFYRVPGRDGTRAWAAMWEHVRHNRDQDAVIVLGSIAPDNPAQLAAIAKRGFQAVGVVVASYPAPRGDA